MWLIDNPKPPHIEVTNICNIYDKCLIKLICKKILRSIRQGNFFRRKMVNVNRLSTEE